MGWKLSDFPDPRARVEQATAAPGELRETVRAYEGTYEQVWLGGVPEDARTYRVLRDRWTRTDDDRLIRTVIEWEYVDG